MAKKTSTNAVRKIDTQLDQLLKEKRTLDDTASMSKINNKIKSTNKGNHKKNTRKKEVIVVEERKKVSKKKDTVVVEERKKKKKSSSKKKNISRQRLDNLKREDLHNKIEDVNIVVSSVDDIISGIDNHPVVDTKKKDTLNILVDTEDFNDNLYYSVEDVISENFFENEEEKERDVSKKDDLYNKIEEVIDDVSVEKFIEKPQSISLSDVIVHADSLNTKEAIKKYSFLDILVFILFFIFSILFIVFVGFIIFVCTY